MKLCIKCNLIKSTNDFEKGRNVCRKCRTLQQKSLLEKNPKRNWIYHTINTHRYKGYLVKFNTNQLYEIIKNKEYCDICGKKLDWSPNKKVVSLNSPSLDRVNNEKILTIDNIQLLCVECNATKGRKTMKEFINFCKKVYLKYSCD